MFWFKVFCKISLELLVRSCPLHYDHCDFIFCLNIEGEYGYARWTLQSLRRVLDSEYNADVFPITFNGRDRAVHLEDVMEHLQHLMDIAFKSVMEIEEYRDDDEEYLEAKALFINEDGIPYGAVMYGLFLNLYFSNVLAVHPSTKHAQNAEIENLKIHDLRHKMLEYVRIDKFRSSTYRTHFDSLLDAEVCFEI